MTGLEGKSVIATGGTSGIGRAIAVRFAAEGAHVAINYRRQPEDAAQTDEMVRQALEDAGDGIGVTTVNPGVTIAPINWAWVHHPKAGAGPPFPLMGQTLSMDGGLTLYVAFRDACPFQ